MTLEKMKLGGVTALIVDSDGFAVEILTQMLRGLGLGMPKVVDCAAAAKTALSTNNYDLCICEAELPDSTGAEFVQWVRRQKAPLKYLPVLIATGYSYLRNVTAARDAGAHLVVRKPLSGQILYDRIAWLANPSRSFLESEAYTGIDRRFRSMGPPEGEGRRQTDLSAEIGEATEPNLSQAEIDAMMKPTKVPSI